MFNNTINLGLPGLKIIKMKKTKSVQAVKRVAHHRKACPAEPSLCRQSCSSLCRAKSVCFPSALPLLSEDCALSHSLNTRDVQNSKVTQRIFHNKMSYFQIYLFFFHEQCHPYYRQIHTICKIIEYITRSKCVIKLHFLILIYYNYLCILELYYTI